MHVLILILIFKLKLINLLFELKVRKIIDKSLNDDLSWILNDSIQNFVQVNSDNKWSIFKLARMCARYSYYDLANNFYELISNEFNSTSSDLMFKNWLNFMSTICKAEHLVGKSQVNNINELIRNLNEALSLYIRAQTVFKSSCVRCLNTTTLQINENSNTIFQIRYSELRSEQIKLYIHLLLSSMTYATIPAPVFQFKSSENFSKLGRIAQQMKYVQVESQKLNQKYKELISECFDADQHTLNILNMSKKQNEALIYCINLLNSPKSEQ